MTGSAWNRLATLAIVCLVAGSASAKERVDVVLSYAVGPQRALPQGLRAVAVVDTEVRADETRRERLWSEIAADMIEGMLLAGSDGYGDGLAVADRRNMRAVLQEHDLRATGLVAGPAAQQICKLLEVQGLIVSRVDIQLSYQRGTKSQVDWASLLGGLAGGGHTTRETRVIETRPAEPRRTQPRGTVVGESGRKPIVVGRDDRPRVRATRDRGTGRVRPMYNTPRRVQRVETTVYQAPVFRTQEVEEVSRSMTVQCSFTLLDAATGQVILRHAPPPYRKVDTASPNFLFGQAANLADLDPVDHFIGELVERGVREFVSQLVPVQIEHVCSVVGRGRDGKKAVEFLRAGQIEEAHQLFRAAFKDDDEEHESLFGMGVTAELLGRFDEALNCYRRCAVHEDADDEERAAYVLERQRLETHLGRIAGP